eukprot:5717106-Prymnesium_polylepis.2
MLLFKVVGYRRSKTSTRLMVPVGPAHTSLTGALGKSGYDRLSGRANESRRPGASAARDATRDLHARCSETTDHFSCPPRRNRRTDGGRMRCAPHTTSVVLVTCRYWLRSSSAAGTT